MSFDQVLPITLGVLGTGAGVAAGIIGAPIIGAGLALTGIATGAFSYYQSQKTLQVQELTKQKQEETKQEQLLSTQPAESRVTLTSNIGDDIVLFLRNNSLWLIVLALVIIGTIMIKE